MVIAARLFLLTVFITMSMDTMGQLKTLKSRRNNKRISTFQGNKSPFDIQKRYFSLGLSLDMLNYYGDLSPLPTRASTDVSFTRTGGSIFLGYRRGPRFSMQLSLMHGTIQGSDESANTNTDTGGIYRKQRNLSFRNRITELSYVTIFDLIKNQHAHNHRPYITPYVLFGISIFHHNPQAKVPSASLDGIPFENSGQWVDLRPLGTEGQNSALDKGDFNYGSKPYSKIQIGIPVGLGIKQRVTELMDIAVEVTLRVLFTDYLDDVSKNYVDLGVFGNNELAKSMSYRTNEKYAPNTQYVSLYDQKTYNVLAGFGQESHYNKRGNSSDNDTYTTVSFRIAYILRKGKFSK